MKRASLLVEYSSSEDEQVPEEPAIKKRKLPTLSAPFRGPTRLDDPALHQGRVRTTPHVEGQFVAHIYVPLAIGQSSRLHDILDRAILHARASVPPLHTFWDEPSHKTRRELHLSLSRPIYLRAHQREVLKTAVKSIATSHASFQISFADFVELTNDEATRTFLALEVGAGHHELNEFARALRPTLQLMRQKHYYEQPRFHASFAWALLDQASSPQSTDGTHELFPTISGFPVSLLPTLSRLFGQELTSAEVAVFPVETIALRIGQDVFQWPLIASL